VILGLVVGKTVGVFGATAIAVKLGVGRLPSGTTWRHLFGLAVSAGVGFTVALFVTSLSFDDAATADSARVGILVGSTLAGLVGYLILRTSPAGAESPSADADADAPVVATLGLTGPGAVAGEGAVAAPGA